MSWLRHHWGTRFSSLQGFKLCCVGTFLLIILIPFRALATTRTWDGGGTTNNCSDAANWSDNTIPTASDDVVFDATSTKSATINSSCSSTFQSLQISSTYKGTITLSRSLTVNTATSGISWSQSSGTVQGGSSSLNINGPFNLTGGTFTAPSGTLALSADLSISGGTFNHNNGTLKFSGSANSNVNVAQDLSVYNLSISKSSTAYLVNVNGPGMTVKNALSLSTKFNGMISAENTVSFASNYNLYNTTATLRISGNGTRTISLGSSQFMYLILDAPNATLTGPSGSNQVTFYGNFTIKQGIYSGSTGTLSFNGHYDSATQTTLDGDLIITGGTFNGGTGTILARSFLQSGGAFTSTSAVFYLNGYLAGQITNSFERQGGTFDSNSGTVQFYGNATIAGSTTFYNLNITPPSESFSNPSPLVTVQSGTTQTVLNETHIGTLGLYDAELNTSDPLVSTDWGYALDHLVLTASDGSVASFDLQGSVVDLHDLALQNIQMRTTSATQMAECRVRCEDQGGNVGVDFGQAGIIVSAVDQVVNEQVMHYFELNEFKNGIDESGARQEFTVSLMAPPLAEVSIPLVADRPDEINVSPNTVILNSENWQSGVIVTVQGLDDTVSDGDQFVKIKIGPAISSDTDYSGRVVDTVYVINKDNDAVERTIHFGDRDKFAAEDVKGPITYFQSSGLGRGTLMTSAGGDIVDVTTQTPGVQPGCHLKIQGVVYRITRVESDHIEIAGSPAVDPRVLQTALTNGTVNSITCSWGGGDVYGHGLRHGFGLRSSRPVNGNSSLAIDPALNALWFSDGASLVNEYDIANATFGYSVTDAVQNNGDIIFDSVNRRLWIVDAYDSVSAIDVDTGAIVLSQLAVSLPSHLAYVESLDAVVVTGGKSSSGTLSAFNAATGAMLWEVAVNQDGGYTSGVTYDPNHDLIWVAAQNGALLYAYHTDGTIYKKTFLPNINAGESVQVAYDPKTQSVFVSQGVCTVYDGGDGGSVLAKYDYLTRVAVSAQSAEVLGSYVVPVCSNALVMDEGKALVTSGIYWDTSIDYGTLTIVDTASGFIDGIYLAGQYATGLALGDDGDVWVLNHDDTNKTATLDEYFLDGTPSNQAYTTIGDSQSQLAFETNEVIDSIDVDESLGATSEIGYALSTDARTSYQIYRDGTWQKIAWNNNGVWEYLNATDTIDVADSNSASRALSQAFMASPSHRMSGAELNSLTRADFTALGTVNTLNVTATLMTLDPLTTTNSTEVAAQKVTVHTVTNTTTQVPSNTTTQVASECGNGILETGEECDDGNNAEGDGCSGKCFTETTTSETPNGVPENQIPTETTANQTAVCGNGLLEKGEECDDGNQNDWDACTSQCQNSDQIQFGGDIYPTLSCTTAQRIQEFLCTATKNSVSCYDTDGWVEESYTFTDGVQTLLAGQQNLFVISSAGSVSRINRTNDATTLLTDDLAITTPLVSASFSDDLLIFENPGENFALYNVDSNTYDAVYPDPSATAVALVTGLTNAYNIDAAGIASVIEISSGATSEIFDFKQVFNDSKQSFSVDGLELSNNTLYLNNGAAHAFVLLNLQTMTSDVFAYDPNTDIRSFTIRQSGGDILYLDTNDQLELLSIPQTNDIDPFEKIVGTSFSDADQIVWSQKCVSTTVAAPEPASDDTTSVNATDSNTQTVSDTATSAEVDSENAQGDSQSDQEQTNQIGIEPGEPVTQSSTSFLGGWFLHGSNCSLCRQSHGAPTTEIELLFAAFALLVFIRIHLFRQRTKRFSSENKFCKTIFRQR